MSLLERAVDAWERMGVNERRKLVKVAFHTVQTEELSPHLVRITLNWKIPRLSGVQDVGILYTTSARHVAWEADEEQLLKENWATASREELLRLFPARSLRSLYNRAFHLDLTRARMPHDKVVERHSLRDIEAARAVGVTLPPKQICTWNILPNVHSVSSGCH